jgi:endonuclease YncB( thermonuclease family)
MQENAFAAGDLRVIDGDDLEWRGQLYRLAGYDTPEIYSYRSNIDQDLERHRGKLAKLRLETLIAAPRNIHLIDWGKQVGPGARHLATLLIDGCDVRAIAIEEGWAVDYRERESIDWGDRALEFFGMPSCAAVESRALEAEA